MAFLVEILYIMGVKKYCDIAVGRKIGGVCVCVCVCV